MAVPRPNSSGPPEVWAKMVAGPRILIVDDEPGLVEAISTALRPHYQVRAAGSGMAAVRWLVRHPVDMVILDHRLPDVPGLTVLRYLKRRYPSLLVIFITGYGSEDLCRDVFHSGGRLYLRKPFNLEELLAGARKLLAARQARREARSPVVFGKAFRERLGENGAGDGRIQRAIAFIEQRLGARLGLREVAREAGMSRSRFSGMFKRETNLTFRQFVWQRRVAYAATLLRDTNLSVTEVAAHIGYSAPAQFHRAFYRAHRQSPSQYRREARTGHGGGPSGPQGANPPTN